MKKKEEEKHLRNEWKKMEAHLKAFSRSGDQEELHKFRVQVKKLRAMLTLFENASRQHGLLNCFKPVKQVFKNAGTVREAYTNLKLGEHFQLKNEDFEKGQHDLIDEGIKRFKREKKRHFKKIGTAYWSLKKHLRRIDNSAIAEYYKRQLETLALEMAAPLFTEDMHSDRKKIKILLYNYPIAGKALSNAVTFNSAYLDRLQDHIGRWHDNVVATELFASPEINDKPLVRRIKRQNTSIRHIIVKLADGFWKKATAATAPVKKLNLHKG